MGVSRQMLPLLAAVQSFETLWAYYSQSGGHIYDSDCRQAARDLAARAKELAGVDPRFGQQLATTTVNKIEARAILDRLAAWAEGDGLAPFPTLAESRPPLFGLLSGIKLFLHVELSIPLSPTITMSAKEIEYSERALRWRGYLPDEFLRAARLDPDALVREAGGAESVVVIGDIRRSQQLMAVARDTEGFVRLMGRFIQGTRGLIQKHHGLFDKFTGDGFIAYFNEALCKRLAKNHMDCFLRFVREEKKFARDLFTDFTSRVDLSLTPHVGLAVGADLGQVDFRDVNNHLIAVGDAVVWAHRMSNAGDAGEIIVHAPLAGRLAGVLGIELTPRDGVAKHGIGFSAAALTFAPGADGLPPAQ